MERGIIPTIIITDISIKQKLPSIYFIYNNALEYQATSLVSVHRTSFGIYESISFREACGNKMYCVGIFFFRYSFIIRF